jgi:hypothetical protein
MRIRLFDDTFLSQNQKVSSLAGWLRDTLEHLALHQ